MTKNTIPIRCIRKYKKKDGSFSYHAEVRRKLLKPLRKSFTNLTQAKNWVDNKKPNRSIKPCIFKSNLHFLLQDD